MKRDLTTRRGIDKRIAELTKEAETCDGFSICQMIDELESKREALAKPWEKTRPAVEASLSKYGVTI